MCKKPWVRVWRLLADKRTGAYTFSMPRSGSIVSEYLDNIGIRRTSAHDVCLKFDDQYVKAASALLDGGGVQRGKACAQTRLDVTTIFCFFK